MRLRRLPLLVRPPAHANAGWILYFANLQLGTHPDNQIWAVIFGGMSGSQNSVDTNLVLYLRDSTDTFVCDDDDINVTSTYACADRTHVRPTETVGEWWRLDPRLSPTSSNGPATRAYHTAASLASNGAGNDTCLYIFGGRDYESSVLYSDLWRLCPVAGWLGSSADTTFFWTELSPAGTLPKGRLGQSLACACHHSNASELEARM